MSSVIHLPESLKQGAGLINAGRASVMDFDALVELLANMQRYIAGETLLNIVRPELGY